tara:strand:+ start:9163 stop:9921 length:759 start_codon:yes stop_codon:yes gene_type:complete
MDYSKDLKVAIVIPARLKSSRFPRKPLALISGKPMIERVCNICKEALGSENIYVATDSKEISKVVVDSGYKAIITRSDCLTGTDRVAEASKKINADIILNVQGDEPILDPEDIKKVIQAKLEKPNYIICGYTYLNNNEDAKDINIPKVVVNENCELIYISRAEIPSSKNPTKKSSEIKKQVSIYAFNAQDLKEFRQFGRKSYLEEQEDIEILRFFELDKKVYMVKTAGNSIAVDIPEDIKKVEETLKSNGQH